MVLFQKWPLFQVFFLRQYRPGKCLLWYSRTKKNHFSNFFFSGNIGRENVFYDILERKNAFLGYKNKKFKKWKNWNFSKGVRIWFWSKNSHFCNVFFLRQYWPGKCVLWYSRMKKRLSRLKKQQVQKVE